MRSYIKLFFLFALFSLQILQAPAHAQTVMDPSGEFKLWSDSHITKPPAADTEVGRGKTITVEYSHPDMMGLSYDLFYIDSKGAVKPLNGGFFKNLEGNIYAAEITIFNSDIKTGTKGFLAISTSTKPPIPGPEGMLKMRQVPLGMYSVILLADE